MTGCNRTIVYDGSFALPEFNTASSLPRLTDMLSVLMTIRTQSATPTRGRSCLSPFRPSLFFALTSALGYFSQERSDHLSGGFGQDDIGLLIERPLCLGSFVVKVTSAGLLVLTGLSQRYF